MNKVEAIKKYGKDDSLDEDRWNCAIMMSQLIDRSVRFCFMSLIKLEDGGMIKLE